MNTFKFKSVNKVISLLLAVCFIFTNNVYSAADTLRVPFTAKTDKGQKRLEEAALKAFYGLDTVITHSQNAEALLIGYFIPSETFPILLTKAGMPEKFDRYSSIAMLTLFRQGKIALGYKSIGLRRELRIVYTNPRIAHEALDKKEKIIVRGVSLGEGSSAVTLQKPRVFTRKDIEALLGKVRLVQEASGSVLVPVEEYKDERDVRALIDMYNLFPSQYKTEDLINNLMDKNNIISLAALVAIDLLGGQFSMEGAMPRRDFMIKSAQGVVAVTVAQAVSPLVSDAKPADGLQLEELPFLYDRKILLAEESLQKFQDILSQANSNRVPVVIRKNKLEIPEERIDEDREQRRELKKKLRGNLEDGFKSLDFAYDLFKNKESLKNMITLAIARSKMTIAMPHEGKLVEVQDVTKDISYALIGAMIYYDTPELRTILEEIKTEEIGELAERAGELLTAMKVVNDAEEIKPVWPKVVLRKVAVGIVQEILNWMTILGNKSPYRLIKLFDVLSADVYNKADIEMRKIMLQGASLYDGSGAVMAFDLFDTFDFSDIYHKVLWESRLGELGRLDGSYDGSYAQPFIYDTNDPNRVNRSWGQRGFRFKLFNCFGKYYMFNGTWNQWQPIAGENAWLAMSAAQSHYKKNSGQYIKNKIDIQLAEELARAGMFLQVKDGDAKGAIRMAPKGTWCAAEQGTDPFKFEWLYNEVSVENNLSWLGAFRMLYKITGKQVYKDAMDGIEGFLKWSYDKDKGIFCQGAHWDAVNKGWVKTMYDNDDTGYAFATDVELWAVLALGCDKINEWANDNSAAYRMLKRTVDKAGIFDQVTRKLTGLDYTDFKAVGRDPKRSAEWSIFGALAMRAAATYYKDIMGDDAVTWRNELMKWAGEIMDGIDGRIPGVKGLKVVLPDGQVAYLYSDRGSEEVGIPGTGFAWLLPPEGTLHLAPPWWRIFYELGANPFVLGFDAGKIDQPTAVEHRREAENKSDELAAFDQNFPNPFRESTTIQYGLNEQASRGKIEIFNTKGELVKGFYDIDTSIGKAGSPNYKRYVWDGRNELGISVGRGIYFVKLTLTDRNDQDHVYTRKMVRLSSLSTVGAGVVGGTIGLASNEAGAITRRDFVKTLGGLAGAAATVGWPDALAQQRVDIITGDAVNTDFVMQAKAQGAGGVESASRVEQFADEGGHLLTFMPGDEKWGLVRLDFKKSVDLSNTVLKMRVEGVKGLERIDDIGLILTDDDHPLISNSPIHARVDVSKDGIASVDFSTIEIIADVDIRSVKGIVFGIGSMWAYGKVKFQNPEGGKICIKEMWLEPAPKKSVDDIPLKGFELRSGYGSYIKEGLDIKVKSNDILQVEMWGMKGREIGMRIKDEKDFWHDVAPIKLLGVTTLFRIPLSKFEEDIKRVRGVEIVVGPKCGNINLNGADSDNSSNLNNNHPQRIQIIHVPAVFKLGSNSNARYGL